MLIKLPSGDQINPASITSCRIFDRGPDVVDTTPLVVIVEYGAGGQVGIDCVLQDTAEQLRDQIAEQVNAACYELRSGTRA